MPVFLIIVLILYLGLIALFVLASIDKAFLDSIIVVISLLGLILNNLQRDCPEIEKIMKKLTDWLVHILSLFLIIFGLIWILSGFLGAPNSLLFIGGVSVIIGGIIWSCRKKIKQFKGLSFAIYFGFILIIYLIIAFDDSSTKATIATIKKLF